MDFPLFFKTPSFVKKYLHISLNLCVKIHTIFFYCVIFGLTNFFNKIYYQELFFDSCHFFRWGKIWSIRSRDRITWGSSNILTTWYVFPSFFLFLSLNLSAIFLTEKRNCKNTRLLLPSYQQYSFHFGHCFASWLWSLSCQRRNWSFFSQIQQ